jgi:hypothetical protein
MLVSDPIGSIFSKLWNIKERTGTGGYTVIHSSSRAHNLLRLFSIGKCFLEMLTDMCGDGGGDKQRRRWR